jgi:hypothetical protein
MFLYRKGNSLNPTRSPRTNPPHEQDFINEREQARVKDVAEFARTRKFGVWGPVLPAPCPGGHGHVLENGCKDVAEFARTRKFGVWGPVLPAPCPGGHGHVLENGCKDVAEFARTRKFGVWGRFSLHHALAGMATFLKMAARMWPSSPERGNSEWGVRFSLPHALGEHGHNTIPVQQSKTLTCPTTERCHSRRSAVVLTGLQGTAPIKPFHPV